MSVIVVDMTTDVKSGISTMSRRALAKTAFQVMALARWSIITHPDPSDPGTPPHTHPRLLRQSIAYRVEPRDANLGPADTSMFLRDVSWRASVGPQFSVIGEIGNVHEFGGRYKGENYPARPFMAPALEAGIDFFAESFGGSLGE